MQNYQNVARYINWVKFKILPLTCSVIKTLRIQFRALDSCLQKSTNANKNQQSARSIKLLKNVKLLKKYYCVSANFGELK